MFRLNRAANRRPPWVAEIPRRVARELQLAEYRAEAHAMLLRERVYWPVASDADRTAQAGVLARVKLAVKEGALHDGHETPGGGQP